MLGRGLFDFGYLGVCIGVCARAGRVHKSCASCTLVCGGCKWGVGVHVVKGSSMGSNVGWVFGLC